MAYCFTLICLLQSVIAVVSGSLMMFFWREVSIFGHGKETASKLLGSTPHDQLLIQTSDSLAGMLLFSIGIMLFMVSFVRDREFQSFFCERLHCFTYSDGSVEVLLCEKGGGFGERLA